MCSVKKYIMLFPESDVLDHRYLSSDHCAPGIVPGTGERAVNKTSDHLQCVYILVKADRINKNNFRF